MPYSTFVSESFRIIDANPAPVGVVIILGRLLHHDHRAWATGVFLSSDDAGRAR